MPPVAETTTDAASPAVSGAPRLIQQAEGAALLAAAVIAYGYSGGDRLWHAELPEPPADQPAKQPTLQRSEL